jgi:hypothetical protein
MKVMARLKGQGVGFVYKTTAETSSDDVLHEIRVAEKDFSLAQDIIIGLENNEKE